jgi:outer membrane protein assembly factor BamE
VRCFLPLVCSIALAACKSLPDVTNIIKPYRIEIQQGNFISQEMLNQLKIGMTREQVRYVLGTPLVTDIFHADRWDYVYYRERAGRADQRRVSVHFDKEGRLERIGGDTLPPVETPAAETPADKAAEKPVESPAAAPAAKP